MNKRIDDGPKITIITVVYNGEKFLENAIRSVISQSYPRLEYIVVDGGSSDRTVEIIESFGKDIDLWVSEPDRGISDAMNKGVKLASGEYVLFIHSDDYLNGPEILRKCIEAHPLTADIHSFDVRFFGEHSSKIIHTRKLGWWVNIKGQFCHQGMLCKRTIFEQIGPFDISLKIKMDYDFLLRFYRAGLELRTHRFSLASMRDTGVSSARDIDTLNRKMDEEKKIHFRYCRSTFMRVFYHLWWALYPRYKKLIFMLKAV